jgi:hypothetical protein
MIALDFKLFKDVFCTVNEAHVTNAYWDTEAGVIRFIDADFGWDVWNLHIDELDEKNFNLTVF